MSLRPRYFVVEGSSPLSLESVLGTDASQYGWTSRYPGGPIIVGVDGPSWQPSISNVHGMLVLRKDIAISIVKEGLVTENQVFPVRLREDWPSSELRRSFSSAPEYLWIRIPWDIEINPQELRWPAHFKASPNMDYRKVPIPSSHGGMHLFGATDKEWTYIFCTYRFLEAAHQHQWPGLYFRPMDMPFAPRVNSSINYLSDKWPPVRWYPAGYEAHPNNLEPV